MGCAQDFSTNYYDRRSTYLLTTHSGSYVLHECEHRPKSEPCKNVVDIDVLSAYVAQGVLLGTTPYNSGPLCRTRSSGFESPFTVFRTIMLHNR